MKKLPKTLPLRGNLLRKVGIEKYEFSHGTGTIRFEIDKKRRHP